MEKIEQSVEFHTEIFLYLKFDDFENHLPFLVHQPVNNFPQTCTIDIILDLVFVTLVSNGLSYIGTAFSSVLRSINLPGMNIKPSEVLFI